MIPDDILARVIEGAHAGSIVFTASEAETYYRSPPRRGTAVHVDGKMVEIAFLPVYVIPDKIETLAEISEWQNMIHLSHTEGLIDHEDAWRLWHVREDGTRPEVEHDDYRPF